MDPKLIILALAPIAILLAYVWARDKYEKEPWRMLFIALLLGAVSVIPILVIERFLSGFEIYFFGMTAVFWRSFVVAAFTEELFKLIFLFLLIWKSPEFNEKFDGIVYAVFVSLGFASIENILYVFDYGAVVGWTRALTAVPAHFLFGVTMGFYIGMARFYPGRQKWFIVSALFYPMVLHGTYDFILMAHHPWGLLVFIPFVIFMWRYGLKRMKQLSDHSIYKNDFRLEEDLLKRL